MSDSSASENDSEMMSTDNQKFILLVEDEPCLRKLLKKALERKGYNVLEASDGLEGKNLFDSQQEKINLIISDVRMAGMDGAELLQYIRTISNVPFIMNTGFSGIIDPLGAAVKGASFYLPKPFKVEALLSAVAKLTVPDEPEEAQQVAE